MDTFNPHSAPSIDGQILGLEQKQARAVREFILGDATAVARLRVLDNAIAALRAQLT